MSDNYTEKEQAIYDRVTSEIQQWPVWKQEAYNRIFAISKFAKTVTVNKTGTRKDKQIEV